MCLQLFWAVPAKGGADAVQAWYDEMTDPGYDFETHSGEGTGHFTQVIWRGTTHVGGARSADGQYICCNYTPPGNFVGQHPENVPPLLAEAPEAETQGRDVVATSDPQSEAEIIHWLEGCMSV